MELKLDKISIGFQVDTLPIEPKWNWNTEYENIVLGGWISSNRTKVELKLGMERLKNKIALFFQSNQSGIETNNCMALYYLHHLPIEPKWNWNRTLLSVNSFYLIFQSNQSGIETQFWLIRESQVLLPIEPKWNWNLLGYGFTLVYPFLPIEPKWNWNRTLLSVNSFYLIFQSNQSGIETQFWLIRESQVLLPIEPKWNWNLLGYGFTLVYPFLPIEPKWNWNMRKSPAFTI